MADLDLSFSDFEDTSSSDIQFCPKDKEWYEQWYGTIEEKPDTEQDLFRLQNIFYRERDNYEKAYKQWKHDVEVFYASKAEGNPPSEPVDKSKAVWSEMLKIVYQYAKSCIKKRCIRNRWMEDEEICDKASTAALSFMNQYNKRRDFVIGASFAGMLNPKIVEALYKDADEESHISLNQILSTEGNAEFGDTMYRYGIDTFMTPGLQDRDVESDVLTLSAKDVIREILAELDEVVGKESRLAFLVRLYLKIVLQYPKTRHIKRLFMEHWVYGDYKAEQVINATVLELENRLKGVRYDYDDSSIVSQLSNIDEE